MTQALCGYATLFYQIIWHDDFWQMVLPGAFDSTLQSGSEVKFLLDHQPGNCVGSTRDDILELCEDEVGLAFRAKLVATADRQTAMWTAGWMARNGHQDMSIAFYDWGSKSETRKIDGKDVVCWTECNLHEISYLFGNKGGAVRQTHAAYHQDADYNISLREQCKSGQLRYDGAAINFTRALQNLSKA